MMDQFHQTVYASLGRQVIGSECLLQILHYQLDIIGDAFNIKGICPSGRAKQESKDNGLIA